MMTLYGDCSHLFSLHGALTRAPLTANSSDVTCHSRTSAPLPSRFSTELLLVESPLTAEIPSSFRAEAVLNLGMHLSDTLSFSSIRDRRAMLCLTRSFVFKGIRFEPMEVAVDFFSHFSVFQNLSRALLLLLLDTLTEKEVLPLGTVPQRAERPLRLPLLP